MKRLALLLSVILFACPVAAQSLKAIQFEDGKSVKADQGYAYVIVRQIIRENPPADVVLVRALGTAQLGEAWKHQEAGKFIGQESNVVLLDGDDSYAKSGDERIYVMAIKPGTYILAEQAAHGFIKSIYWNGTCACMGSVGFAAKEGVLTDLGYLLSARNDKPSTIPEFANVVRKKETDDPWPRMMLALRPATEASSVPEPLGALRRELADYHAVNKFPNYFGAFAERLMPVAGILDYDDQGNVLDLKTGKPAVSISP